jgi:hypothetical protein
MGLQCSCRFQPYEMMLSEDGNPPWVFGTKYCQNKSNFLKASLTAVAAIGVENLQVLRPWHSFVLFKDRKSQR